MAKTNRVLVLEAIGALRRVDIPVWALVVGAWVVPFTIVCTPAFFLVRRARRTSEGVPQGSTALVIFGFVSCAFWMARLLTSGLVR